MRRLLCRIGLAYILLASIATGLWARTVTSEEAASMVSGWLDEANNRLGQTLSDKIDRADVYLDSSGKVIYYVISLQPTGFVVSSPDDGLEPVIAFDCRGKFDPATANPLFSLLSTDMSQRSEEVFMAAQTGRRQAQPVPDATLSDIEKNQNRWAELIKRNTPDVRKSAGMQVSGIPAVSDMRVAPLLSSAWDQKTAQGQACYNYYCPPGPDGNANNYYSGCVATAMGELMRYWQYPGSASGNTYIYANMPLTPQTTSPLTLTHRQAIGRLLRDAGASVNMAYGAGGSSANLLIADNALTSTFAYGNARDLYQSSGLDAATRNLVLRSNLAAHHPVIMGIRGAGGHAVVCDGFGYSSGALYYHISMGWGGNDSAWYNLPTVDGNHARYSSVDALVYNIYTNGVGEIIAGRVLNSSGAPISNATVTATGGYTAVSDANGYYGVRVPSSATYTLTAIASGYEKKTLAGISVGSSSISSSGPCGNYVDADFSLGSFILRAVALSNSVMLRWPDPLLCGYADQTVMLRHDTSGYPSDTTAGSLTYQGTNQVYEHTGLTPDQPYYYTIWVSDNGLDFVEP